MKSAPVPIETSALALKNLELICMKYVSVIALLVSAVIHLLPVPGVTGTAALGKLYGIEVLDANTSILLQHRALLFGLLAILMLLGIGLPKLRVIVLWAGLFSAASFVSTTQRPIGMINPVSSASGIKMPGDTIPFSG
jgi:hypothetical protein